MTSPIRKKLIEVSVPAGGHQARTNETPIFDR
jgi:hypothetical protein